MHSFMTFRFPHLSPVLPALPASASYAQLNPPASCSCSHPLIIIISYIISLIIFSIPVDHYHPWQSLLCIPYSPYLPSPVAAIVLVRLLTYSRFINGDELPDSHPSLPNLTILSLPPRYYPTTSPSSLVCVCVYLGPCITPHVTTVVLNLLYSHTHPHTPLHPSCFRTPSGLVFSMHGRPVSQFALIIINLFFLHTSRYKPSPFVKV